MMKYFQANVSQATSTIFNSLFQDFAVTSPPAHNYKAFLEKGLAKEAAAKRWWNKRIQGDLHQFEVTMLGFCTEKSANLYLPRCSVKLLFIGKICKTKMEHFRTNVSKAACSS